MITDRPLTAAEEIDPGPGHLLDGTNLERRQLFCQRLLRRSERGALDRLVRRGNFRVFGKLDGAPDGMGKVIGIGVWTGDCEKR